MTIYEIKRRVEASGDIHFFSRKTMKFFGQTLRDFSVRIYAKPDEYIISAPMRNKLVVKLGIKTVRIFDAKTNRLVWPNSGRFN